MDELTIEHLIPQSQGVITWSPQDVGALGNLLFVTKETNEKLDDKSFEAKLPIIKAEVPWAGDSVLKAKSWSTAQTRDRGFDLAKLGREKIWKL
jgi:hypothetical protein